MNSRALHESLRARIHDDEGGHERRDCELNGEYAEHFAQEACTLEIDDTP